MRKRVLKPGDTHLMAPNEEYCRLVYEYHLNGNSDVSIEVYDKSGITHQSIHRRLSPAAKDERLHEILGDGWEMIFAQDYNDWSICCKKRPRSESRRSSIPLARPFMTRNAVIGALAVCAALLVFGWIAGQMSNSDNQPAPSSTLEGNVADQSSDSDSIGSRNTGDRDRTASSEPSDTSAAQVSDIEAGRSEASTTGNSEDATDQPTQELETTAAEAVPAIALQSDEDPFVQAVRIAQEAVLDGRVANTQDEWDAIASRWQQAADLMERVPAEDERYDIAQDRIEQYEANREAALSEAEKL